MSDPGTAVEPKTLEAQFIDNLSQLDRGDRARLRRNAGRTLGESRGVLGLFYRILPYGVPERDHERFFLIATLYPLATPGSDDNFGGTLRRVRAATNRDSLDRRVTALLDADEQQLRFRLRQLIKLAESNRVSVNWQRLLEDLRWWSHPERRVQRQWAMTYFGNEPRQATSNGSDRSESEVPPMPDA